MHPALSFILTYVVAAVCAVVATLITNAILFFFLHDRNGSIPANGMIGMLMLMGVLQLYVAAAPTIVGVTVGHAWSWISGHRAVWLMALVSGALVFAHGVGVSIKFDETRNHLAWGLFGLVHAVILYAALVRVLPAR